jgi:copper homeostasis protein
MGDLESAMKTFLFELCAESLEAARVAELGGADRVELCSELSIGGVTPALELTAATVNALSIPVHVLIRPRGGDFAFTQTEFASMQQQVEQVQSVGAAGVAVGVLLPNGRVDVKRTRILVELARPMAVTFHRAFDETSNLAEALEAVVDTGADCLLTSGGATDVLSGADSIARLGHQAADRIRIMAGGGLRLANLVEVLRRSGVSYAHGSLTRRGTFAASAAEVLKADVREAVRLMRSEFADIEAARAV